MNFLTGVSQKMTKKAAHSSAKYHKLTRTDDGFVDLQYQKQKPKIPWGGILLAVFLFIAGGLLIAFASLLFTGHINGQHTEGAWPLLILGILMFIPGFYHLGYSSSSCFQAKETEAVQITKQIPMLIMEQYAIYPFRQ